MPEDLDLRKLNTGYKRRDPREKFDRISVYLTEPLINRVRDIYPRMSFVSISEFIRFAVRKELDHQIEMIYNLRVPKPFVKSTVKDDT